MSYLHASVQQKPIWRALTCSTHTRLEQVRIRFHCTFPAGAQASPRSAVLASAATLQVRLHCRAQRVARQAPTPPEPSQPSGGSHGARWECHMACLPGTITFLSCIACSGTLWSNMMCPDMVQFVAQHLLIFPAFAPCSTSCSLTFVSYLVLAKLFLLLGCCVSLGPSDIY